MGFRANYLCTRNYLMHLYMHKILIFPWLNHYTNSVYNLDIWYHCFLHSFPYSDYSNQLYTDCHTQLCFAALFCYVEMTIIVAAFASGFFV